MLLGVVGGLVALGDASAQAPIKIGFLAPLSGAIAAAGKDMYSGCELFWQENGWQMAGREVEVALEDNEGSPATTITKARKLVENDKVHLLMGVILSNVAYALVPYVEPVLEVQPRGIPQAAGLLARRSSLQALLRRP
jgi:branched-chain amino acid transport system substrate-binding protein